MIKVLVAGEGPNELGGWAGEPSFRETSKRGVVEALMRALVPEGWTITHAETWRRLPSLRVGGGGLRKEARNALVLALRADEAKCEAVVFLRDRDRDEDRERAIREGVERARAGFTSVAIAPGVVVECLEAWLLAIRGVKRTEAFSTSKAAAELADCRNTAEMVALVEQQGLEKIAPDATSLLAWCEEVRGALAPSEPASAT